MCTTGKKKKSTVNYSKGLEYGTFKVKLYNFFSMTATRIENIASVFKHPCCFPIGQTKTGPAPTLTSLVESAVVVGLVEILKQTECFESASKLYAVPKICLLSY